MRVDLFSTVHKGIRALLFDAALEVARVDVTSSCAVDALVERLERVLDFAEEHAAHEDAEIVPAVRIVDPGLADKLAAQHLDLDAGHHQVARSARALALAAPPERGLRVRELAHVTNDLTSRQLAHMNDEEILVNAVLWGALGDAELNVIRERILARMEAPRRDAWRGVLVTAVNPGELALVLGGSVRVD